MEPRRPGAPGPAPPAPPAPAPPYRPPPLRMQIPTVTASGPSAALSSLAYLARLPSVHDSLGQGTSIPLSPTTHGASGRRVTGPLTWSEAAREAAEAYASEAGYAVLRRESPRSLPPPLPDLPRIPGPGQLPIVPGPIPPAALLPPRVAVAARLTPPGAPPPAVHPPVVAGTAVVVDPETGAVAEPASGAFDVVVTPGTSLQAIVDGADGVRPGGSVLLLPGTHQSGGPIKISREVHLFGRGKATVEGVGNHMVESTAVIATLDGLLLRSMGIMVTAGGLRVQSCSVVGASLANVIVTGHATDPTITGCELRDSEGQGLVVCRRAKGRVEGCEISGSRLAGIEVTTGGDVRLSDCKITGGRQAGVWVSEAGKGTMVRCEISGHAFSGLEISTGGDPHCVETTIRANAQAGCWVHDFGRGRLDSCTLVGNQGPNLMVTSEGDPLLAGCTIVGGRDAGVLVHQSGRGRLESTCIEGNAGPGIGLLFFGDALVLDCVIKNGRHAGIVAGDGGRGRIQRCDIEGNAGPGLVIYNQASPLVADCRFRGTGWAAPEIDGRDPAPGILAHDCGRGRIDRCEITGAAAAGVEILRGADPTLFDSRVSDCRGSGVVVTSGGRGRIERCEILRNSGNGVEVRATGGPFVRGCTLSSNGGAGCLVMRGGGAVDAVSNLCSENRAGGVIYEDLDAEHEGAPEGAPEAAG